MCMTGSRKRAQVEWVLNARSQGIGFDCYCWSCVEILGKLPIPHCLGPPSRNGYLVHISMVGSTAAGCIDTDTLPGNIKI